MEILSTIGSFLFSVAFSIGSILLGPAPDPTSEPGLSAAIPASTAVFETSLAAPISSSASSLTLAENAVRGGGAVSGYACFTIDEGSSQAEFVCGTVAATAVTDLMRGVSPLTGTTTD